MLTASGDMGFISNKGQNSLFCAGAKPQNHLTMPHCFLEENEVLPLTDLSLRSIEITGLLG